MIHVFITNQPLKALDFIETTIAINSENNTVKVYPKGSINPEHWYGRSHKVKPIPAQNLLDSATLENTKRDAQTEAIQLFYAQICAIASAYPNENISFHLDSRDPNTKLVYAYFKQNPSKIPANIKIKLNYNNNTIRGKGDLDVLDTLPLTTEEVHDSTAQKITLEQKLQLCRDKLNALQSLLADTENETLKKIYETADASIGDGSIKKFHEHRDRGFENRFRNFDELNTIIDAVIQLQQKPQVIESQIALQKAILSIPREQDELYFVIKPLLEKLTSTTSKEKIDVINNLIKLEASLQFPQDNLQGQIKAYTNAATDLYEKVKIRLQVHNITNAEYEYMNKALIYARKLVNAPLNLEKANTFKDFSATKIGFFNKAYSIEHITPEILFHMSQAVNGFLHMLVGCAVFLVGGAPLAAYCMKYGYELSKKAFWNLGLTSTADEIAVEDAIDALANKISF